MGGIGLESTMDEIEVQLEASLETDDSSKVITSIVLPSYAQVDVLWKMHLTNDAYLFKESCAVDVRFQKNNLKIGKS